MTEPTKPAKEPPGRGAPTFDELRLHPRIRRGVEELGYVEPTPIQRGTIPPAVEGQDIIGRAQTGTGKTAAFLLPMLERLLDQPPGRIYGLILTPTRELALQADEFLRKLAGHIHLRGAPVYGGVGMGPQERALRGGAEIIVATPGRLLDHMRRGYVDLRSVRILVLDEADRMLDMGFLPDVRRILKEVPTDRQTMLFSATMPPEVLTLSKEFLRHPRFVQVEDRTVAAVGVSHLALPVPALRKSDLLVELLQDETMSSVLVFVRTKHRANNVARQLARRGLSVSVLHGNRSQHQRVAALEGFREGTHRILVATDIAARGLDVEGVSHVVNFDVPHEPEIYVHRVGRTARARRRGDAFTLVSPEEERDFSSVEKLLGLTILRARIPNFDYEATSPAPVPRPSEIRLAGVPGRRRPARHRRGGRPNQRPHWRPREARGG